MALSHRPLARRMVLGCALLAVAWPSLVRSQPLDAPAYAVVPRPSVLTPKSGRFTITFKTAIQASPAFRRVAHRFARDLANPTGLDLTVTPSGPRPTGIAIRQVPGLGEEAYRLDVTPAGIVVEASEEAGAFYALETVKQLMPPAVYRSAPVGATAWTVPAVHIEDAPRFRWRGAHLDAGRHFMPKEFVKKYIDLLARHKMNRFHWHLTEDQGWRLEIRKYPRLTEVGSCRAATIVGRHVEDPAKRVMMASGTVASTPRTTPARSWRMPPSG